NSIYSELGIDTIQSRNDKTAGSNLSSDKLFISLET
ncbi:unnamed protein product, partial [marine sediment metagenome]